ncbi:MAG: hypothetical protein KME57_05395 [Scytonema hyalinum WJT4-NPBG1]|jgi:hypothetical protein|nr:hypothetical protein [Scytonema hyalinum WJT4-NPBG1]
MIRVKDKYKIFFWYFLVLVFAYISHFLLIIKNFSPLIGFGDEEQWEYAGFYLLKNLTFTPFPHLNLVNNQVFYPYGTNSVFQPWGIERDIFYAGFEFFFGMGPWIQIYYLLTLLVTAIGSFRLLLWDYGFVRASGSTLIISFFNFYALYKYPIQLSYSVIHWTVLSFIADFLIVKRVALKQHLSLKLVLLRVCLLLLSMGQELGYIAGYALMSFSISLLYIASIVLYRKLKSRQKLIGLFKSYLIDWRTEFFSNRRTYLLLVGFSVVTAYVYLPLVFQIFKEAKSFDFTGVITGAWWTSPLRLVIPFLPFFNPETLKDQQIFGDLPEALVDGSPGLSLLILGILGIWQARKRMIIFVPLIIIFLLCLVYHPTNLPTLKIFPWFSFNRVAGRSTVIYPVILGIFALHINLNWLQSRSKQLITGMLVLLASTEIYTAYSFKLNYQPYVLDQKFFTYMNYVKDQPGEAVLDWPFCAQGGNGVGSPELCPYFWKNASIFALRRFHEKKVMGQYFGRLHPSQIEPYLQAGWDKLFLPDNPDISKASKQRRCFRPEEWSFFTDFYKFNDFAGINLYVDLLPETCVNEFYTRFGTPNIETKVPGAGNVQFIKKPSELRNEVDLALGTKLRFDPFLDLSETDLLKFSSPYGLTINGLSTIEQNSQSGTWRWALGPETRLKFKLQKPQSLMLFFSLSNPIDNQDIVIEINGATVDHLAAIKKDDSFKRSIEFLGNEGDNTVLFKYKKWNQYKGTFARKDQRHLAAFVTEFSIKEKS